MDTPRDFSALPETVRLEDTVESVETSPAPDPQGGQNAAQNDALRD
jgi:hypothetical protein